MADVLKATIDIEIPLIGGIDEEQALKEISDLIWEINAAMGPMIRSNKILSHKIETEDEETEKVS